MIHKTSSDPHELMLAWDRTWKPHHLPMWAKKRIRLNAIARGLWVKSIHGGYPMAESLLRHELFDHWGSVKRGEVRALIAQPYGNHDALAEEFAEQMGCFFKSFTPGPWNEGTFCYEFTPKPEGVRCG